jgi:hypothetical protein
MPTIDVGRRRLEAYNAHDLAGFVAEYSDAVLINTDCFFSTD